MGKRGPKPKNNISLIWSSNLAYAVGLLATDGCMSPPGHLIDLTSKDAEQLQNFSECIDLPLRIGTKGNGSGHSCLRVQFKNVVFYEFLLSIGLTPAKSKTLGVLKIPKKYFFDFLRGYFDGDGSIYSYWDPRWKSSFMFYIAFSSASEKHINWLRESIAEFVGVHGHVTHTGKGKAFHQLRYAKSQSREVLQKMYARPGCISLSRKRLKVERILRIVAERL